MTPVRFSSLFALALATMLWSGAANAHPLAPSVLELAWDSEGNVSMSWREPLTIAQDTEMEPVLPAGCALVGLPEITETEEARDIRSNWTCPVGALESDGVRIDGLANGGRNVLADITWPDGTEERILLHRARDHLELDPTVATPSVSIGRLIVIGADHLLQGYDHVLFLLGLLWLVRSLRQVVMIVTAFTVGHTASLALAVAGLVGIPGIIVEVGIAASILYIALEVLEQGEGGESSPTRDMWTGRRAIAVCLGFGLLHGLGFAGAFAELGVQGSSLPLSVLGFNLGVELGQLVVVIVAFGLSRLVRPTEVWSLRLRTASGYAIGGMSAFWIMERIAPLVG